MCSHNGLIIGFVKWCVTKLNWLLMGKNLNENEVGSGRLANRYRRGRIEFPRMARDPYFRIVSVQERVAPDILTYI